MLRSASNKIATLRLGSLVWPGPCEKALLASGSAWPLERSHVCSPLRVWREETVKYVSRGRPCCSARACHIHLRWQKRWLTALTGACIRSAHAHPNPRLKDSPPSPSLSLSSCLHQSVVFLSVSHLSNPVTLLQAPPSLPPPSPYLPCSLPPSLVYQCPVLDD